MVNPWFVSRDALLHITVLETKEGQLSLLF